MTVSRHQTITRAATRTTKRAAAIIVWLSCCTFSSVTAASPLTLDRVLDSAQTHFPGIIAQQANRLAAGQRPEIARGAFDPVVSNNSYARTSGFWNGRINDTQVSKRIGVANARVYSGYRLSRGDFPIYEDILFTNSGGEVKAGIEFSLLRDRAIDPERLALVTSEIEVNTADLGVMLTRFDVQRRATRSYKRWLAAGFRLEVYRNLLQIAEQRDVAINQRIAHGDAAPILLVENQRNLIRRRELVNQAEQLLAEAAQAMSLYWRDAVGTPIVAAPDQLPPEWTVPNPVNISDLETVIEAAIALRPDLLTIDNDIEIQRQQLALERNRLAPKLDVGVEVSNDFGGGSPTREGTDTILSLNFEVPIGLRRQKASVRAAEARLSELRQQRRLISDEIRVAVLQLLTQLKNYHLAIDLAIQAQEQNRLLEVAERKLFEEGASDFFLLNLREENTAEAQIRRINAKEQFFLARTDYYAATAQAGPLGL